MKTIRDVAKRAKVSITTVSHVINETRYVSPELAQAVTKAIQELGYQPNAVARSLRRNQTLSIGMIVPDNSNPFFAEVASGIEDACYVEGYSVILCNSHEDPVREEKYVALLTEKQVDGIVFVAAGTLAGALETASLQQIPVVVVDRELENVKHDSVVTNNYLGGWQATSYLIQKGHQRIACITGPSDLTPSWKRFEGYRAALDESGLFFSKELVYRGDFRETGGYSAMTQILSLPEPPSAVFVCNDLMAIGAIGAAIDKNGLSVPEDVAVVGFDDINIASYTRPPLTTISQPKQEMGRLAVDLLLERIHNRDREPQRHTLETELVIRGTT